MGVGPEQNFTHIVVSTTEDGVYRRCSWAICASHMMYKALFEMSANRADFLSRLFSRKRPAGHGKIHYEEMFAAYAAVQLIRRRLTRT
jgi:hypothetical protein